MPAPEMGKIILGWHFTCLNRLMASEKQLNSFKMVVRKLEIALVTGDGGRGGRVRGKDCFTTTWSASVGGWRWGDGVGPGQQVQQGAHYPWVPRVPEAQEGPSPKLGCSFSSARLRQLECWSRNLDVSL